MAGAPASLAVVALDTSGLKLHPGFTGTVTLTWLDARDDSGASTGSCRSSWKALGAAGSVSFSANARVTATLKPPAAVQVSLNMGWAILNAAGLSFIGLGVRPPTPEWGILVAEGSF